MIERAQGLVLRTLRFSETSLILRWLTREFGRVNTLARGALRPKSPFRGKLDLFYEADLSFARSSRSDLHTLREVSIRETHPALRRDIGRLRQASYCAALVEQATERDTPLPELFELLRGFLDAVSQSPPGPEILFAFELKLLNELGLQPDVAGGRLTPGGSRSIRALTESSWTGVTRLKLSEAQTAEIRQFLHGFLAFHLGNVPAGRPR